MQEFIKKFFYPLKLRRNTFYQNRLQGDLLLDKNMRIYYNSFVFADVAKLADAQVSGSCGRPWGFKSLRPHHFKRKLNQIRLTFFYAKKAARNERRYNLN